MRLCYLAFFGRPDDAAARIPAAELSLLRNCVSRLPGLGKAHFYTPAVASDVYTDDGPSPLFGMQLYFDEIERLEAAIGPASELKALVEGHRLPSLESADATQQAMLCREFPVPRPKPVAGTACSYVVHYPGPAEDLNAWLGHYLAYHPRLMARLPDIREIEVLSRIDWVDALPWRRVHHMQRNRVLFDSPEALSDALHSPVRHEMRADLAKFPPHAGGSLHQAMATEVVAPT